uniref:CSON007115 protein n=1 Tax=Culicoides sonorensis TaxID=179676 RepID=A0A336MW16_CULSO
MELAQDFTFQKVMEPVRGIEHRIFSDYNIKTLSKIGSTHIKIFIIIVFESFACLCNTMTGFFANSYKQKDMVVDEVSNPAK